MMLGWPFYNLSITNLPAGDWARLCGNMMAAPCVGLMELAILATIRFGDGLDFRVGAFNARPQQALGGASSSSSGLTEVGGRQWAGGRQGDTADRKRTNQSNVEAPDEAQRRNNLNTFSEYS